MEVGAPLTFVKNVHQMSRIIINFFFGSFGMLGLSFLLCFLNEMKLLFVDWCSMSGRGRGANDKKKY